MAGMVVCGLIIMFTMQGFQSQQSVEDRLTQIPASAYAQGIMHNVTCLASSECSEDAKGKSRDYLRQSSPSWTWSTVDGVSHTVVGSTVTDEELAGFADAVTFSGTVGDGEVMSFSDSGSVTAGQVSTERAQVTLPDGKAAVFTLTFVFAGSSGPALQDITVTYAQ